MKRKVFRGALITFAVCLVVGVSFLIVRNNRKAFDSSNAKALSYAESVALSEEAEKELEEASTNV